MHRGLSSLWVMPGNNKNKSSKTPIIYILATMAKIRKTGMGPSLNYVSKGTG